MKHVVVGVVVAGLLAASANAAILSLVADDGSGKLDLGPGETGNVNIILEIQEIDEPGFENAFIWLNDEDNQGDGKLAVVEVIQGFDYPDDLYYDRTGFTLPADISNDGNNEYALLMARLDANNWGPGTYTLDTLVIMNGSDQAGEHPISFEKGDRAPIIQAFDFISYTWGTGMAGIYPWHVDPGVGGTDNPFMINTIPEPATAVLVALGGLALRYRQRGPR